MSSVLVAAGVIAGVLIAVVTAGVVRVGRLHRTALQRLGRMVCPRCSAAIPLATAAAARDDWRQRVERAHAYAAEHNVILRIDPCWRFPCPGCGVALVFDPSGTELDAYDPPAPPGQGAPAA